MEEYLRLNRENWDQRGPAHAASAAYGLDRYVRDPTLLSKVVAFDRERLGDLHGTMAVHLQCHIGTDTISLARLGAEVTGLDFSAASLVEARRLAERTATPARFVEADVYRAGEVLPAGGFDLVYTGIGALCWLPDIATWAQMVAELLAPGGRLFVRDGHPMLLAADDTDTDRLVIDHPYFERSEPTVIDDGGSYVDTGVAFSAARTLQWNHGLGQIVTAVLDAGLQLTGLVEHDSLPWQALPGQMVKDRHGEWRLADRPWRLAASFTLQARRA